VGCSGFAYTFDYADEVGANDSLFESHDATVVVDRDSGRFVEANGSAARFFAFTWDAFHRLSKHQSLCHCGAW